MEKTNVMRILQQHKIDYESFEYPHEDGICVEGSQVAQLLNQDEKEVFKTLVAVGKSKQHYVFVLPVSEELDLKKAAISVGEKSVELIPVKELLKVTGYIRGGCSPIGMKKVLPTVIDDSALLLKAMICSAGKIGYQVKLSPKDLKKIIPVSFVNIRKEDEQC